MRKLIERYVRKKVWEYNSRSVQDTLPFVDEISRWVMEGYPFHWRARLWAATHCGSHNEKRLYEWLVR